MIVLASIILAGEMLPTKAIAAPQPFPSADTRLAGKVQANVISIAYESLGPTNGETVLLIMGTGGHDIAGVLGRESMTPLVEGLCEVADSKSGDRVKTLRGSMRGTILRVLPDGRVVWRADSGAELTGQSESLIRKQKP